MDILQETCDKSSKLGNLEYALHLVNISIETACLANSLKLKSKFMVKKLKIEHYLGTKFDSGKLATFTYNQMDSEMHHQLADLILLATPTRGKQHAIKELVKSKTILEEESRKRPYNTTNLYLKWHEKNFLLTLKLAVLHLELNQMDIFNEYIQECRDILHGTVTIQAEHVRFLCLLESQDLSSLEILLRDSNPFESFQIISKMISIERNENWIYAEKLTSKLTKLQAGIKALRKNSFNSLVPLREHDKAQAIANDINVWNGLRSTKSIELFENIKDITNMQFNLEKSGNFIAEYVSSVLSRTEPMSYKHLLFEEFNDGNCKRLNRTMSVLSQLLPSSIISGIIDDDSSLKFDGLIWLGSIPETNEINRLLVSKKMIRVRKLSTSSATKTRNSTFVKDDPVFTSFIIEITRAKRKWMYRKLNSILSKGNEMEKIDFVNAMIQNRVGGDPSSDLAEEMLNGFTVKIQGKMRDLFGEGLEGNMDDVRDWMMILR